METENDSTQTSKSKPAEMNNSIAVSVVIPVHNAVKFLPMTLGSLFEQTLKEIEIICVENDSNDGTVELLHDYAEKHANMTVISIPSQRSPGPGRNEGMRLAKGKYVYFCDSDDYVYPDALERMYLEAENSNSDLVFGAIAYTYDEGKTIKASCPYNKNTTRIQYMEKQYCSVWEKLVKKTLLDRTPPFVTTAFEDVTWSYEIIALAEHISFVQDPVYLWYRREGSISSTVYSHYMDTIIASEESLFQNVLPEYLEPVEYFMARRARWQMTFRWYLRDRVIESIKCFWSRYSANARVQKDKSLYNYLKYFAELPDTLIPDRIYVGGFSGSDIAKSVNHLTNHAFRNKCEVVVLSEKNCNVKENEQIAAAWEAKNIDLVEKYFAAKKIYENGGFFCSPSIRFRAPLNCLRYQSAIFSFSDYEQFSDSIFGGRAGSEAFAAILASFAPESLVQMDVEFSERIKTVLIDKFGILPNAATKEFDGPVSVYSPEFMLYDLYHKSSYVVNKGISYNTQDIRRNDDGSIILSPKAIEYFSNQIDHINADIKYLKRKASHRVDWSLKGKVYRKLKGIKQRLKNNGLVYRTYYWLKSVRSH